MAHDPYKEAAIALTDFLSSALQHLATYIQGKKPKKRLGQIADSLKTAASTRDIDDLRGEYRKVLRAAITDADREVKKKAVPLVETLPDGKMPGAVSLKQGNAPDIANMDMGLLGPAETLDRLRSLCAKFLNALKNDGMDEGTREKIDALGKQLPQIRHLEEWRDFARDVQEVQYAKIHQEGGKAKLYEAVFKTMTSGLLLLVDKKSILERRIKTARDPKKLARDPWILNDLAASVKNFFFAKQQELFVHKRERNRLKSIIISLVRIVQDVAEKNQIFMENVDEYANALEETEDLKDFERVKSNLVLKVGVLRKKNESLEGEMNQVKKKLLLARSSIHSLEEELKKAQQESLRDPLTRVFCRAAFEEKLEDLVTLASKTGESFGLILCDVDRFNAIKIKYGKTVGNEMLKALAHDIKEELQSRDYLARLRDNSFIMILLDRAREEMKGTSERVREAIQSHEFLLKSSPIPVTASVVALTAGGELPGESLIERLETLMRGVKKRGGNLCAYGPLK